MNLIHARTVAAGIGVEDVIRNRHRTMFFVQVRAQSICNAFNKGCLCTILNNDSERTLPVARSSRTEEPETVWKSSNAAIF